MSQNIESPIPVSNLGGGFDRIQIDVLQAIRDHGGKAIILAIPFFYELLDANITVAAAPTATPNKTATAIFTSIAEFSKAQPVRTPTPMSTYSPLPDTNLGDLGIITCVGGLLLGAAVVYLGLRQPTNNIVPEANSKLEGDFPIQAFREYLNYQKYSGSMSGENMDLIVQSGQLDVALFHTNGYSNIEEHLDAFYKSGKRQTFNNFVNFFQQRMTPTPRYIHERNVADLNTDIGETRNLAKEAKNIGVEAQRRVGALGQRVTMAENRISLLSILMPNRNRPPDPNSRPLLPSGKSDNK